MYQFQMDEVFDVRIERVIEGRIVGVAQMVLLAEPHVIMQSHSWKPGVVAIENGDADAFEAEWVPYCMNEGGELSAETFEPDEQGIVRRFTATRRD